MYFLLLRMNDCEGFVRFWMYEFINWLVIDLYLMILIELCDLSFFCELLLEIKSYSNWDGSIDHSSVFVFLFGGSVHSISSSFFCTSLITGQWWLFHKHISNCDWCNFIQCWGGSYYSTLVASGLNIRNRSHKLKWTI